MFFIHTLKAKGTGGHHGIRQSGVGLLPKDPGGQGPGQGETRLLQEEIQAGVEEERVSRAVGLWQQGAWTRWEIILQRRITWANIMQADL